MLPELLFLLAVFNLCCLLVVQRRVGNCLQLLRRHGASSSESCGTYHPGTAWKLASTLDGTLRIYTAMRSNQFSLRFVVASLPTGAAEIMCLPREVDLISTWNAFCGWGEVLRLGASPTELWAGAVLALPWPVPRHAIIIHAQLHDRMAEEGCILIEAHTPDSYDGRLPEPLRGCTQLRIASSAGRLTPLPAITPAGPPRTAADVQLTIDLAGLGWMGGMASGVPQWLVNLILFVVSPIVYRRALAVLADLSPTNSLGARLHADDTGVYAAIRAAAGQQPAHVCKAQGTVMVQ